MLTRIAALWLPAAIGMTVIAAVLYAAIQQDLRLGADDPQQQLAHDAAARLDDGALPAQVIPKEAVNAGRSLAPFVIVYDRGGMTLATSAPMLGTPPMGVFDSARSSGENRRTWLAEPGDVRVAAVIVPYRDGYVLAGRALREVESREDRILLIVAAGWLAALGASAAAAVAAAQLLGRKVSIALG